MERFTDDIATKISIELNLDSDNRETIAYGMFALLHIALSIFLVIVFGMIFHVTVEALIVCFTGSLLRKYSGGAHAGSPSKCAVIGTVICVGLALFFVHLIAPVTTAGLLILLGIGIFPLSYYLIYKLAPVDSPSKPIKKKEKIIRMKKGSIFILSVYILFVVINAAIYNFTRDKRFMIYTLSIYGGMVWQVFTLTKHGHNTMNKIDTFLDQILKIRRGVK